jgi:hypothetical protein
MHELLALLHKFNKCFVKISKEVQHKMSIIVDVLMILSQCLRAASNPSRKSALNSRKAAPLMPPKTSTYSVDSLKGAASKPIFPGVLLKMNPKSMCIK